MRLVIQRVSEARVRVDGEVIGEIGAGLVVLVGVTHSDTEDIARTAAAKVHQLRIMAGELSAADIGAGILVISQFTLYADTRKGRRPSWLGAAPGPVAEPLVSLVAQTLRERGATVATGLFGADMAVELVNDGPMTIVLDFPQL